jgi:tetratricopeptide (TPR) repeat protein
MTLVSGMKGHALAIELAVRELARRGAAVVESAQVATMLRDLAEPRNGSPAGWARAVGDALELDGVMDTAVLVAQFRGYVSVVGYAALRGDGDDFDAAAADLDELVARGTLTRISPAVYSIHPGLAVALATTGEFEPPGRRFAEAMAKTATMWAALAEGGGGMAPWAAEAENVLTARRLASRRGWWPLVIELLDGLSALGSHGGMHDVWREQVLDAAPDFVNFETGEPVPQMENHAHVFLAYLASVAEMEGNMARAARLRTADVRHRRDAAAGALRVPQDQRTEDQHRLVRRLAVGLTNFGNAQSSDGDPAALDTMQEAAMLAHEIGDWRLEALNRLNLGVYWMTVARPPAFDNADAEFVAGYNLTVADDPGLAGKLMTERGTVFYERGIASGGSSASEAHFQQAAKHLQLAVGLREPDAVLFHQLGQVSRRLGEYDASRAWFEQAIELRETELTPGAGADARVHLAQSLEEGGLVTEALGFARSASAVLAHVDEPDPGLQFEVEQTLARLSLLAR